MKSKSVCSQNQLLRFVPLSNDRDFDVIVGQSLVSDRNLGEALSGGEVKVRALPEATLCFIPLSSDSV